MNLRWDTSACTRACVYGAVRVARIDERTSFDSCPPQPPSTVFSFLNNDADICNENVFFFFKQLVSFLYKVFIDLFNSFEIGYEYKRAALLLF